MITPRNDSQDKAVDAYGFPMALQMIFDREPKGL